MRTVLHAVTGVPVSAAIGEALPFANSTLAGVCVAQAFHHLHSGRAIPELHRVVAPGGYLTLVWNVYEDTDLLKQAIDRIIDRYIDPRWPAAAFGDWRAALDGTPLFEAMGSRSFQYPHRLPAAGMAALLLTSADVASLPVDVQRAFARDVDALAATLPSEVVIQSVTRRRTPPPTIGRRRDPSSSRGESPASKARSGTAPAPPSSSPRDAGN
jgi:SAM-dependent methyltransferase